jgi:serine/threonine protein kinase
VKAVFYVVNQQPLNSGGHGELYLGQRSDNGEPVVVKYLRDSHLPHERKGFNREIGVLMRRLRGLVPLLGWNVAVDRPYYVMPYFPGGTLSRYAGGLAGAQLTLIAKELALTLANLHRTAGAHGDVKPDNLLVSQSGSMQLADPLGAGGALSVLFSANHGGTPGYWAPEVRAGGPVSVQGDVYSFGATLWHLATGQRPQDGMSLPAPPNVSPKTREVIIACFQRNPKLRPTMDEVIRIMNGEQWPLILASRQQAEAALQGILLLGAIVVGIAVLGKRA